MRYVMFIWSEMEYLSLIHFIPTVGSKGGSGDVYQCYVKLSLHPAPTDHWRSSRKRLVHTRKDTLSRESTGSLTAAHFTYCVAASSQCSPPSPDILLSSHSTSPLHSLYMLPSGCARSRVLALVTLQRAHVKRPRWSFPFPHERDGTIHS